MRGSPPCAVALCRFGMWRTAIATIGVAVVSTLGAWAVAMPAGPSSPWIVAAAIVGAACAVAVCMSLWRPAAGTLRWDGQAWSFAPHRFTGEPIAGQLTAHVDLDAFILLRFRSDRVGTPARAFWLPAQRRGLEREWHAFRCAVHSPRPVAGATGVDAPAP